MFWDYTKLQDLLYNFKEKWYHIEIQYTIIIVWDLELYSIFGQVTLFSIYTTLLNFNSYEFPVQITKYYSKVEWRLLSVK